MKREVYQYTFADLLCMQQDEQHLPYGGVTLLDDIDAAVLCTSSNLTSYLLDEVQATHTGIDRVLILATNNPQDIAPALRRPGRFGRWIHFSGMGEPEFRAMLRMYECDCADTLKYTTGCTPAAVQATAQAYYGRAVDSWEAAMSATLDQKIEND
jgi:hypothetical protein